MEQARGGAGSDWAGTTGKDEGVASGGVGSGWDGAPAGWPESSSSRCTA